MIRLAVVALVSCASALHEPEPVSAIAPGRAQGRTTDELVREADAAWKRRGQPGQAAAAQALYLDAAAADNHRIDGLLGAMRAMSFRIEYEAGVVKKEVARREVDLGQWCQRRAPADAECAYRLAIALGQQAREAPSTGLNAVGRMVNLLRKAIAVAPRLDAGGPHRVLALVLLRAPAWPLGPGDSEGGLAEARAAAALYPDSVDNQLVLGEALAATGSRDAARTAYGRALALATAARDTGDPEGAAAVAKARAALVNLGR